MAKTLVDMTAEEREECVGMWALIEGISLAVIAEADETSTCVVIYPEWDGDSAVHLNEMVTPRHDLPRAWTPDGEPIPAKEVRESIKELTEETYEYGVEYKYLTNRGAEWRLDPGVGWHKTYRDAERAASASVQFRIVRRRVSPPEVINE